MKMFLAGGALLAVSLAIANPSAARPRAPARLHRRAASAQRRRQAVLPGLPQRRRAQRQPVARFSSTRRMRPRNGDVAEKMIAKLRAGMMPPPGEPRPAGDTLDALVETLETQLDASAAAQPNPGAPIVSAIEPRRVHRRDS